MSSDSAAGQPDETQFLVEMMLQAELFCSALECDAQLRPKTSDTDGLRLKISQCRGFLGTLQKIYEEDQLTLVNGSVRGYFRQLVMALMWTAHLAGSAVRFEEFRRLVQIESGFTYLLMQHRREWPQP